MELLTVVAILAGVVFVLFLGLVVWPKLKQALKRAWWETDASHPPYQLPTPTEDERKEAEKRLEQLRKPDPKRGKK